MFVSNWCIFGALQLYLWLAFQTIVDASPIVQFIDDLNSFRLAIANASDSVETRLIIRSNLTIEYSFNPIIVGGNKVIKIEGQHPAVIKTILSSTISVSEGAFSNPLFGAGDVNGDGVPDFITGSTSRWNLGFGGGSNSNNFPLNMATTSKKVFALGDINGDAFSDFAYITDEAGRGAVQVVFGGQKLSTSDSTIEYKYITFTLSPEMAAQTVQSVGDVNGDSIRDFAISYVRTGSFFKGVFLVLGSSNLFPPTEEDNGRRIAIGDTSALQCEAQTLISLISTDTSSIIVSAAGDLDQDGFDDFLLGVPPNMFIVFGGQSLEQRTLRFDASVLPVISSSLDSSFASALASNGDFDGDGFIDIASSQSGRNEVILMFGDSSNNFILNNKFDFSTRIRKDYTTLKRYLTIRGGASVTNCGRSLQMVDFDLDGRSDLVIYCASAVVSQPRRLFILFGDDYLGATSQTGVVSLTSVAHEIIFPGANPTRIDAFDANVGDVDEDGFPDLIVSNSTRSFLVKSPGKARHQLRKSQGIFIATDAAQLTLGPNLIIQGTEKAASVQPESNAKLMIAAGNVFPNNLACPAEMSYLGFVSSCKSCKDFLSFDNSCAHPCEDIVRKAIASMETRFETNLDGFKVAANSELVLIVGFDTPEQALVATLVRPLSPLKSNCIVFKDVIVARSLAIYRAEATSESAQYSGLGAMFFDAFVDQTTGQLGVVYLSVDGNINTRMLTDELSSRPFSSPPVSVYSIGPTSTIFATFTTFVKTCSGRFCFLAFFSFQTRSYTQLALDVMSGKTTLLEFSLYPVNQLELHTLVPADGGSATDLTIKGAAIFVSTVDLKTGYFVVTYAQRDDSDDMVRSSALFVSVFEKSESTGEIVPLTEQNFFDFFADELIIGMRLVSSPMRTILVASFLNARILVAYEMDPDRTTFIRLGSTALVENVPFPHSFDVSFIQKDSGENRLLIALQTRQEQSFYEVNITTSFSVTRVSTQPSASTLPPMVGVQSLWSFPQFGLFFVSNLIVDPLNDLRKANPPKPLPFDTLVNAHLAYYPFSGFPIAHHLIPFQIPGQTISHVINVVPSTCPRGFACLNDGAILPCPQGYFQTAEEGFKTLAECSTANVCAQGFFCGPGAAVGSTYVKIVEPSSTSLDLQIFTATRREVIWTLRNLDAQRTVRFRLANPESVPSWISSISNTNANRDMLLSEGFGFSVAASSNLELTLTLDATSIPVAQKEVSATLVFEWWMEFDPQERFSLALPIKLGLVPLLVVPHMINQSLAETDVLETTAILYNIFPTNEIRARVDLGCDDNETIPEWLELVNPSQLEQETVLLPGLGQRLAVSIRLNATRASTLLQGPTLPAVRLESCLRFKCNVDGVDLVERVPVTLVATQQCPRDYFSASTGTNSELAGCIPCGSGSYQPASGSKECIPAPKCPKGTYSLSNGLRFNDTSCISCAKGTFQPLEGSVTCLKCPRGQYSSKSGADACEPCPEQLLGATEDGATSAAECEATPGFFKVVTSTKVYAQACPQGVNCSMPVQLESLPLEPGYWRATFNTTNIIPCRKNHYCKGLNLENTSNHRNLQESSYDSDTYCINHHEGVMCEACPEGFAKRGNTRICTQCNDSVVFEDQGAIAGTLLVLLLIPTVCFTALLIYQRITRKGGLSVKSTARIWACMKLIDGGTKPKLLIGLFQVVSASVINFRFSFPPGFTAVAESFSIFYLDTFNLLDLGCAFNIAHEAFYKGLLIITIAPFIALAFIFVVNRAIIKCSKRSEEKKKQINTVSIAVSMFTLFLVYPGVSNTVIKTFICETFDDGRKVLKADYAVMCWGDTYDSYRVYAGFMVAIYVVGVPLGFASILFRFRHELNPNKSGPRLTRDAQRAVQLRDAFPKTKPLFFLVHAYIPYFFWFEPMDLVVRLFQTSVILAVDETWSQILFLVCITVTYLVVLVQFAPYIKPTNHVLAIACQVGILVISLSALVNTLGKNRVNQTAMDFVCFFALFVPVFLALPLHLVQIRVSRWKGFFDAHEFDDGEEEIDDGEKEPDKQQRHHHSSSLGFGSSISRFELETGAGSFPRGATSAIAPADVQPHQIHRPIAVSSPHGIGGPQPVSPQQTSARDDRSLSDGVPPLNVSPSRLVPVGDVRATSFTMPNDQSIVQEETSAAQVNPEESVTSRSTSTMNPTGSGLDSPALSTQALTSPSTSSQEHKVRSTNPQNEARPQSASEVSFGEKNSQLENQDGTEHLKRKQKEAFDDKVEAGAQDKLNLV